MRNIGIELEVLVDDFMPDNMRFQRKGVKFKRQQELHRYHGADVYIVEDGSIRGRGYGYEFVTRPLNLSKSKDRHVLRTLIQYLNDEVHARVNWSCGYHLHVEADGGTNFLFIKNILKFYTTHQDVFYAVNPRSRWNNDYAKVSKKWWFKNMMSAKDMGSFIDKFYGEQRIRSFEDVREYFGHYDSRRYHLLNLHSYFMSGGSHYEIRVHSGTTNYDKIINWILLHLKIAEYISKQRKLIKDKFFTEKKYDRNRSALHYQIQLLMMRVKAYKLRWFYYERLKKFYSDDFFSFIHDNTYNPLLDD